MAEHGMKRLPVVDAHGRLAGLLSRADVLRAVAAGAQLSAAAEDLGPSPGASLVGDLMLTEVPTVRPEAPIDEVVHSILNSPTHRVVVTSPAGVVQGIIMAWCRALSQIGAY
jgi:CBS domain-containing protein